MTSTTSHGKDQSLQQSQNKDVQFKLIKDAFPNQAWSMYTILFFLTDNFEGGETEFLVDPLDPTQPARNNRHNAEQGKRVAVRTPVGGVLCFPHGEHPLHCLHASAPVTKGIKYIIRSDVLFEL
jgi:hypothetical protein